VYVFWQQRTKLLAPGVASIMVTETGDWPREVDCLVWKYHLALHLPFHMVIIVRFPFG